MFHPSAFHAPQQERSRRTLNRILEAARTPVGEHGAAATSVQQIVERAESSVGSFYARFEGKDDLRRGAHPRLLRRIGVKALPS